MTNVDDRNLANSRRNCLAEFFTRNYGDLNPHVISNVVDDDPPISIQPVIGKDCLVLYTIGMSFQPMNAPPEWSQFSLAELFIQLPLGWDYSDIDNPNRAWPIEWLQNIASFPHRQNTWLGGPAMVLGGPDGQGFLSPDNRFSGMLVIDSHIVYDEKSEIHLYRLMPLYHEEILMDREHGLGELLTAMDRAKISYIVDPDRQPATL